MGHIWERKETEVIILHPCSLQAPLFYPFFFCASSTSLDSTIA